MGKKQVESITTGVLIIIFIIILINNLKPKRKRKVISKTVTKEKVKEVSVKEMRKVSLPEVSSKEIELQRKRAEMEWGMDPFYHILRRKDTYQTRLVLKGISIGKGKKNYAFINDQILTVGDTISGYEIVEVEKRKVLLRKGNESFYLALPEE
jgi:hypothetical protein